MEARGVLTTPACLGKHILLLRNATPRGWDSHLLWQVLSLAKDLHGPRGHKAPDEKFFIGCHCPCCPRDHEHGPWLFCALMSGPQNQRVVLVGGSPLIGSREDVLFPTASLASKLDISVHQIQDLPLSDRHYQVQLCPFI